GQQVGGARILADDQLVARIADQLRRPHRCAPAPAAEDVGDRLHRLAVGLDGELEPAHAGRYRLSRRGRGAGPRWWDLPWEASRARSPSRARAAAPAPALRACWAPTP